MNNVLLLFLVFTIYSCGSTESTNFSKELFKSGACESKVASLLRINTDDPYELDRGLYELSKISRNVILSTEQVQFGSNENPLGQADFLNQGTRYQVIAPISFMGKLPEYINHPSELRLEEVSRSVYREYVYYLGHFSVRLVSDGNRIVSINRNGIFSCRPNNSSQFECYCSREF